MFGLILFQNASSHSVSDCLIFNLSPTHTDMTQPHVFPPSHTDGSSSKDLPPPPPTPTHTTKTPKISRPHCGNAACLVPGKSKGPAVKWSGRQGTNSDIPTRSHAEIATQHFQLNAARALGTISGMICILCRKADPDLTHPASSRRSLLAGMPARFDNTIIMAQSLQCSPLRLVGRGLQECLRVLITS